ncbi:MAG: rhomboid family intramembrane serine protease [Solirubrobacterales bacterium]
MNPSPVGMRCPECASERTRVVEARSIGRQSMLEVAPATMILIAVNVLVFFGEMLTGMGASSVQSSSQGSLLDNGAFYGPQVANGEWWRIVSSGFLHLSILHVGMNMLLLYLLGNLLEPAIGTLRFVVIYFTSLVAGSLGSLIVEPSVSAAGASGAVFGLMGAALVASRSRGLNPFESGIGGLIILNLIITFAVPGIAKGGHLGGLVGGFIAGALIFELDEKRQIFGRNRWLAPAIGVGLGVGYFAATIALAVNKFPWAVGI